MDLDLSHFDTHEYTDGLTTRIDTQIAETVSLRLPLSKAISSI